MNKGAQTFKITEWQVQVVLKFSDIKTNSNKTEELVVIVDIHQGPQPSPIHFILLLEALS